MIGQMSAERLHEEIKRSLTAIHEVCETQELELFPAICAMVAIIHSYQTEHPESKPLIAKYTELLSTKPPTEIH